MSAQHTPGADWEMLGRGLVSAAEAARREQRRFGCATRETLQRVRAAMAMADAALSIDDIKARATGAAA